MTTRAEECRIQLMAKASNVTPNVLLFWKTSPANHGGTATCLPNMTSRHLTPPCTVSARHAQMHSRTARQPASQPVTSQSRSRRRLLASREIASLCCYYRYLGCRSPVPISMTSDGTLTPSKSKLGRCGSQHLEAGTEDNLGRVCASQYVERWKASVETEMKPPRQWSSMSTARQTLV